MRQRKAVGVKRRSGVGIAIGIEIGSGFEGFDSDADCDSDPETEARGYALVRSVHRDSLLLLRRGSSADRGANSAATWTSGKPQFQKGKLPMRSTV